MDAELIARVAEQLDVHVDTRDSTYGMSQSQVHIAERKTGETCVLKVTSLRNEDAARAGRRELDFYRELAERVPIRTPTLFDDHEDDDVIAMLLSAHGEVVPATSWNGKSWLALAIDLARLHGTVVSEPDRWQVDRTPAQAVIEPDTATIDEFWREDLGPSLDAIMGSRELLVREILQVGPCFVHGDCHTENILHDGSALVWIDWQTTGIGNPALDLAFLNARATPSGSQTPPELLAAYCRERNIDVEQMRRSVLAAELGIFVFEWPPYAQYDSPAGTKRVRRRTRYLADQWRLFAGPA